VRQRAITAAWFTPLILGVAWLGNPWLALILCLTSLFAARELYDLISKAGGNTFTLLGVVLTPLFLLSVPLPFPLTLPFILTLALLSCLLVSLVSKNPLGWLWTLGGALYIGWLLSFLLALRGVEGGREWVILALLTTFANDTSAFFSGRAWGRHHLLPSLSPGKTWEGGIGGVLAAILVCLALTYLLDLPINYKLAIPLGLLIAIFAQSGDLVESSLKRAAGVKDSGRLLPGHGGVLDRFDSILFTSPLVYYYVIWLT